MVLLRLILVYFYLLDLLTVVVFNKLFYLFLIGSSLSLLNFMTFLLGVVSFYDGCIFSLALTRVAIILSFLSFRVIDCNETRWLLDEHIQFRSVTTNSEHSFGALMNSSNSVGF